MQSDLHTSRPVLEEALHLLNLIYVRNKNQHRHQKWWKWLSIFRREVRRMVSAMDEVEERRRELVRGMRKVGESVKRREPEEVLKERVEWMRRVGVEECWVAFTSLVTDTQFSSLGIVLVATLARFTKVIGYKGPTSPVPAAATSQLHTPKTAAEIAAEIPAANLTSNKLEGELDLGVVVSRKLPEETENPLDGRLATPSAPKITSAILSSSAEGSKKRTAKREEDTNTDISGNKKKKRRRKKVDAIDELFGDLA